MEGAALPDLEILAPMPVDSLLRTQLDAAGIFVEQPPFARQWASTRWAPIFADNVAETGGGVVTGYQLTAADLQPTPLTTLARLLTILQNGNVNDTTLYATRFDLFDQAAALGLGAPAAWVALYLDGNDQPVAGIDVTPHLRIFDNANRQRTFDVYFEQDEAGVYRVASLAQVEPFNTDLITPAPALPTFTPTPPPASTRPSITPTACADGHEHPERVAQYLVGRGPGANDGAGR